MKVYDFTTLLEPEMKGIWPGHPRPKVEIFTTFEKEGYEARYISMDTHAGTHIDAPKHIVQGRRGTDEFSIEQFVGEGVVLDLPKGPYEEITHEELQRAKPAIKERDIVFLHVGWGHRWVEPWDDGVFKSRPGITTKAAEWLVSKKVKAVGIDNLTISSGKAEETSPGKPSVHRILCSNDVIIVECLVNLKPVLGKRLILAIGAIPVKGSDGGQARVFGIEL